MIAAFSTSSPQASLAVISRGQVLWSDRRFAPYAAGGACLEMLERALSELGVGLASLELFAADLGPGSFTGVRVGVTLAKAFAFAEGREVAGADAFDLISRESTVVLPSRRGEWFVREPGKAPFRSAELPLKHVGYGQGIEQPTYPDACRMALLVDRLNPVVPELLVPGYLVEPSISIPKKTFQVGLGR